MQVQVQVWSLSTHTCTCTHITGLLPDLVNCACTALSTSDVTQQQRTHPHPTLFLSCHYLHPHSPTFNVQPSPTFRTRVQQHSTQYCALCCCALILVLASLPSPTISPSPTVSPSSSPSRHCHCHCHCHHPLHLAIAITAISWWQRHDNHTIAVVMLLSLLSQALVTFSPCHPYPHCLTSPLPLTSSPLMIYLMWLARLVWLFCCPACQPCQPCLDLCTYHRWVPLVSSFFQACSDIFGSPLDQFLVLWFVSFPMVSSYFLCIIELISFSVCSLTIGYIAYFFSILQTPLLLSCNPTPFCSLIIRREIPSYSFLFTSLSYLWIVFVILSNSLVSVTCSYLLIIFLLVP